MASHDGEVQRVAIVGMGCIFPGASDVGELWRNVCGGVDATSDVPPSRWDPVFYDPDPDAAAAHRFYCRRGGFVDEVAHFDATAFGIMPVAVDGGEPDQFLALAQAAAALHDSDDAHGRVDSARVGVVVGRGGYRTAGLARLDQRVHVAQQLVEGLRSLLPDLDASRLDQVRDEYVCQLGPERPESSIGLVPNLAASRIANRFDFNGPAYTVDAACASTLVAVDHAMRELSSGRCDLVLAGGSHHCHDVTLWSVFTQLRALSFGGRSRPFSRAADGILIGEGTGFFVLKRLADAEHDDDRIYAVVAGTGVASDGRAASLMHPDPAGQVLALERAWQVAGLDHRTVGLVEAHGTATPAGDAAELDCLRQVFGERNGQTAGLGSIKSMIGHAMPAAGAAGLAKAALAVHHGVLPPTLHADDPHPGLADTRFRLVHEAEPWEGPGPRRAGVNAFGFGGINAHVVLEQHGGPTRPYAHQPVLGPGSRVVTRDPGPRTQSRGATPAPAVLLLAGSATEIAAELAGWEDRSTNDTSSGLPERTGPMRIAVVEPDARRIQLARAVVEQGKPWRGRNGVWFEPTPLLGSSGGQRGGGKVAFLFPGVEPNFEPQVDDVAATFGGQDLIGDVSRSADHTDLESQSRGIVAVGRLLHRVLGDLGVVPDMVAGHSLGEWCGELATGVVAEADVDALLATLRPGTLPFADVAFVALGCGADVAAELVVGLDDAVVSHDNCPHQAVVCAPLPVVPVLLARAKSRRVLARELPFRSGFHSPAFADHLPALAETFASVPMGTPRLPLWSATICQPYPSDPEEVRQLAARHLVEPVRFRELVLAMHDAGARAFVQVGVGNLGGFVEDTLRDREVMAVAANTPKRSGMAQLGHVAAALWAAGRDVAWDRLSVTPSRSTSTQTPAPTQKPTGPRLDLGIRLVRDLTPLDSTPSTPEPAQPAQPAGDPGPARPAEPRERVTQRRLSLEVEPAWADHAFFRQRPDWPYGEDRFPLVPMTGIVELLCEAAQELWPELVPVAVHDVAAFRWLVVDPPADITVRAVADDEEPEGNEGNDDRATRRVKVSIDGHARATVELAPTHPEPPPVEPDVVLRNPRSSHIDPARFYVDRHMFHGPAFQGVRDFRAVADDGARGVLESLPAPGALLDNAGQLMGYWLSSRVDVDRLVLPTSIGRIELFGPRPDDGTRLDCTVHITHLDDRTLRGDLVLAVDDRLWCRIADWEDRRFTTDQLVFETLKWPERTGMSVEGTGYTLVRERWPDAATRDVIMRRYLGRDERADYERHNPLAQRQMLLGRIAVKDAVRRWLWAHGYGPLFPAEIVVANDAEGAPVVRGPFEEDLRVSLSHVEGVGVAVVAEGGDVGVDVERVAPRRPNFEQLVLTEGEQRLPVPDGFDRDTWLTVVWAVKEAAAKATGRGLRGRPKELEIVECAGGNAHLATGVRVAYEPLSKEHIVAWTCSAPPASR